MTNDELYLFDTRGYLVISGVLDTAEVEMFRAALEELTADDAFAEEYPSAGAPYAPLIRRKSEIRAYGLIRQNPQLFSQLAAHPRVLPYVETLLPSPWLLSSWAIGKTIHAEPHPWHRGVPPSMYVCRKGRINCGMLGVVFMLTHSSEADGAMVAIPGSHKENFTIELADRPGLQLPGSCAIPAASGDALLFSESLLHTGLGRSDIGYRLHAHFSYVDGTSASWLREPQNFPGNYVSPYLKQSLPPKMQEMLKWQEYLRTP